MTTVVNRPVPTAEATHRRHYALWARDYDQTPNPLLSLEQRFLAPLLPVIKDADVVDVGCGTGRWLTRLADCEPRSLTGVDFSPEMLDRARRKLGRRARLAMGDATSLPIAGNSADIVLASFVASYVSDFDAFASELCRIVRKGGRVFLADVHPRTELSCHWKRDFRNGAERVRMATRSRSIEEVVSHLCSAGLEVLSVWEPAFGDAEQETFRKAQKLDAFYAAAGLPAIYLLELRRSEEPTSASVATATHATLVKARVSLDSESSAVNDVVISDGCVQSMRPTTDACGANAIDLRGYLLLPGLINAHDHLEFGLYPNLGRPPYRNFKDWAADIHERDGACINAHRAVPRDVRVWWGAIRNLLCGVTTVCHHNPIYPELMDPEFPLRVVRHFDWAHSLSIDPYLASRARSTGVPFVLHGCEGVDSEAKSEIYALDRLGVLNDGTLLVHGLGLDEEGLELLNRRSAALIWCPSSNQYLFGRTHDRGAIASTDRVLLGSDSPLTAVGDLLDEVRIAHRETGVAANDLYRMVLEDAARLFQLADGEGRIRVGSAADVIAVRDSGASPAETLAKLRYSNVELVVLRGRVQVASDQIFRRLPRELAAGLRPLQVESVLRWVRAPLARMFREAERAIGCDIKIGSKQVRHVCTAWL